MNLPFYYNYKNIDLNKNEFIKIATSYIPFLSFKQTLKKFIKDYKLTDKELKEEIKDYILNHQIYFINLEKDINGITIHNWDIFIDLKYIKEYIDEKSHKNKLIIRTKIVLILLHELNHGLLRILDEGKKSNF